MKEDWKDWMHDWQQESFDSVITKADRAEDHQPVIVNACVGSGKTALASLALADFIDLHKNEKTVQMFVTPRIKLCAQQSDELASSIRKCKPFAYQKFIEFGSGESDFQIIPVDCTKHEWSRKNKNLGVLHAVFIVCEASLWGKDKNDADKRWREWKSRFAAWHKAGYVFGNVIFDEAHNYKNTEKVERMFGQTVFQKKAGIDYEKHECLMKWFHNVMILSGTPAWYQKDLTKMYPKNVCFCSVKTAIEKKWIEQPVLNLVKLGFESERRIYSNVIIQVLKHEQEVIRPKNGVRLLVNFGGIDEIGCFLKDDYIKKNMGKKFHFITIHSDKVFKSDDGLLGEALHAQVDGVEYTCGEVYDLLESLDSGTADDEKIQELTDKVLDKKPIIVGQVAMIGEGINIKSFSSVITKTIDDTTAMQQIGRVLRKFTGKKWPNVYCVYDNVDELKGLLSDLMTEHDLTSDCFKWGDKIEVKTGSSNEEDEDDSSLHDIAEPAWMKIDEKLDADIVNIQYSEEFEHKKLSKSVVLFSEQDAFMELCKQMQSKFDKNVLSKIAWKMKSNTESRQTVKNLSKALDKGKKKAAENVVGIEEEEVPMKQSTMKAQAKEGKVSNAKESSSTAAASSSPAGEVREQATIEDCAKTVIEITKTVKMFIVKHRDRKKIVKNAKKDLLSLAKYLFSYHPVLPQAIEESGICDNEIFRGIVFDGC